MLRRVLTSCSLALLVISSAPAADAPAPIGRQITDFTLPNVSNNKPWTLAHEGRSSKATVIVFLANGCPVSNAYLPRLSEYHKRFSKDGVLFVGVNSFPNDDRDSIATHAREFAIPFPVLHDTESKLADRLAIERVPTVIVLDAGRKVRYAGRIDDQFAPGVHRNSASTNELFSAISAIINGNEVPVPFAAPAGCKLTRATMPTTSDHPTVTYHKDVSRILQAKCQQCHRPGEAAPFSLLEYKQAKSWSGMIREVVSDGLMPPWHADAPRGHFINDRRLSDDQKRTLFAWIDQGCPEGDAEDAPPPLKFESGWRLGREPDLVLKMKRTINVPGQFFFGLAGMPYEYVPVGEPFAEDTWIQAVEVRPDYREVIHHIIAFILPPGGSMYDIAGPEFGRAMLGAYVPGDEPAIYPSGIAKKIPKGSRILFEVHYTPNGKPGKDCSSIGLILAKQPPERPASTDSIMNERFAIPPGDPNYQVKSKKVFTEPVTLIAMTPHMHVRGKAFKYELVQANGQREVLLNVPKYDFNWQVSYQLANPVEIPAGARIECTAWFDNSAGNPANPDPSKRVRWGQQTWEEMMIGFVEYLEKPITK